MEKDANILFEELEKIEDFLKTKRRILKCGLCKKELRYGKDGTIASKIVIYRGTTDFWEQNVQHNAFRLCGDCRDKLTLTDIFNKLDEPRRKRTDKKFKTIPSTGKVKTQTLNPFEVCQFLSIPISFLYGLVLEDKIPYVKLGKGKNSRIRFYKPDLEEYFKE